MIERSRILLITLSMVPFVIASLIAASILNSSLIGLIVKNAPSYSPLELLIQAIVSTILGSLVIFSLFWVLNRQGRGAKKIMVSLMISPILFFVSIFMGQAFLLILFKGTSSPFVGVVLTGSLGISMIAIALIVIDAFPKMIRNLFVAFYGTIFGVFMGVTIVTSSMIILVVSLIVEDYFLTKYLVIEQEPTLSGRIGEDPFDYTRIQSESVAVGVGDYVAFSLIAAHSFVFFPIYVWAMTMLLAFVGIVINIIVFVKEDQVLPSIPLPALMALFPWLVHIITLSMMAT